METVSWDMEVRWDEIFAFLAAVSQEQEGRKDSETDQSFLISQFTECVYFFKQIQQ